MGKPVSRLKLLGRLWIGGGYQVREKSFLPALSLYYTVFPVMIRSTVLSFDQRQYSIMEEESNQQGGFVSAAMEGRGGRRGNDQHGLKAVALYIKILLDCHERISIKDLTNILFGIICQNDSRELLAIHRGGFDITSERLEQLQRKYGEDGAESLLSIQAVKNLRRRLYDVLNVLISADIVTKFQKKVSLSQPTLASNTRSILSTKNEMQRTREQLAQLLGKKMRAVGKKKRDLQHIAKVYIQTGELIKLNQMQAKRHTQEKLMMPLAFVSLLPGSKLEVEERRVEIESMGQMRIASEVDVMDFLCPISKGQTRSVLATLGKRKN